MPDPMSEAHFREIETSPDPGSYVPELIACIRRIREETRDDRISELEESVAQKSRAIDDLTDRLKRMRGERDMARFAYDQVLQRPADDDARQKAQQLRDYLDELFFDD